MRRLPHVWRDQAAQRLADRLEGKFFPEVVHEFPADFRAAHRSVDRERNDTLAGSETFMRDRYPKNCTQPFRTSKENPGRGRYPYSPDMQDRAGSAVQFRKRGLQ